MKKTNEIRSHEDQLHGRGDDTLGGVIAQKYARWLWRMMHGTELREVSKRNM